MPVAHCGCCNHMYAGMVPALYDDSEKEGLISSIRTELTQQGLPDSREACWAAFVDKVRSNLHVVLAMSPVGDALRSRCRNFPGLVNNTVIDWFEPWPEQVGASVGICRRMNGNPGSSFRTVTAGSGPVAFCSRHGLRPSGNCAVVCVCRRRCKVLLVPSWSTRTSPLTCGQPSWTT